MVKHYSNLFCISGFLLFVLFVFSSRFRCIKAQEVENQTAFDYMTGSRKGPQFWGDLKKEWAACKNGTMQSPIDMSSKRVKIVLKSGELRRSYRPCTATIRNRGHDISLKWADYEAGKIRLNGTDYHLQQAHWHSPSEHTINGRRYPMELHMVHLSYDPKVEHKIAVVALLYRLGPADPFLSKLISNITSLIDQLQERRLGVIDPRDIKAGGKVYYRYLGSLTVPPCTEGVIWTINKRTRTVSMDQVKALRIAVHDYAEQNARPVQPLKQRDIKLYLPNPLGIQT